MQRTQSLALQLWLDLSDGSQKQTPGFCCLSNHSCNFVMMNTYPITIKQFLSYNLTCLACLTLLPGLSHHDGLVLQGTADCRARGTECVQPPEMLLMGRRGQDNSSGCAAPADVWALGCLLYELVTGAMLFNSDDFAKFYCLLTQEGRVRSSSALSSYVLQQMLYP